MVKGESGMKELEEEGKRGAKKIYSGFLPLISNAVQAHYFNT